MSDAVASDGNAHNKYTEKGFFKYKKYIKSNINIIPIATWRYLYLVCVFFFLLLVFFLLYFWSLWNDGNLLVLCISHLRNVHISIRRTLLVRG